MQVCYKSEALILYIRRRVRLVKPDVAASDSQMPAHTWCLMKTGHCVGSAHGGVLEGTQSVPPWAAIDFCQGQPPIQYSWHLLLCSPTPAPLLSKKASAHKYTLSWPSASTELLPFWGCLCKEAGRCEEVRQTGGWASSPPGPHQGAP